LDEDGTLALPVMDYNAEPPPEIIGLPQGTTAVR
jgi:hypothetical protein